MNLRERIEAKKQERAKAVEDIRALWEKAEKEKRSLEAPEKETRERLHTRAEELREEIEGLEHLYRQELELAAGAGQRTDPEDPDRRDAGGGSEARAGDEAPEVRALREMLGRPLTAREQILCSDHYRSAFAQIVARGAQASLSQDEMRAVQQVGIDNLGGAIVAPPAFVTALIKAVDDQVHIRQLATKHLVTDRESLGMASLDSDPDDAEWTSELQTGAVTDVKFGKRELKPHDLSKRAKISRKLIRVSAISVETILRERLAYKFAVTKEKAYNVGDGHNKPLGVFVASNDGIPTSRDVAEGNTSSAITMEGLKAAKWFLKGAYLSDPSCRWLAHRDFWKQVDNLRDDSGASAGTGGYLWQPSTTVGQPDRLLNIPISISEFAPNTFTTGKYVALLGAFRWYHIADALDFEIQRLLEVYAEQNQIALIGRDGSDGMPVLAEAFARVTLG